MFFTPGDVVITLTIAELSIHLTVTVAWRPWAGTKYDDSVGGSALTCSKRTCEKILNQKVNDMNKINTKIDCVKGRSKGFNNYIKEKVKIFSYHQVDDKYDRKNHREQKTTHGRRTFWCDNSIQSFQSIDELRKL